MGGIPKDIAQKIDDLTQTLQCTEENFHKAVAQRDELKKENEQLKFEIVNLKAKLWDMASQNWY